MWYIVSSAVYSLHQALYASKIVSYAQGFMLMREAAKEFKWNLNYPSIALMWRGGCIIRRYLLEGEGGRGVNLFPLKGLSLHHDISCPIH